jgi:DNA-binding CsgD family transcriptional regulator/tetratricopeptide (TPR) repeat protein
MELLERDLFLRELDTALKEVVLGQGRVALVSGEAGIGKTSLVEHFTHIHEDSVRVLWGTCDSLFTPRPLGPLLDISMQLEGELPTLLNSNAERQAIFSACLVELQHRPTIVVFEDVHWADEATLDLIKFIGRRIQHTTTLFILTYRDDELSAGHPLRLVLGDLPRPATHRLQLLSLSEPSVFVLAKAADQPERAHKLFDTTGGNPFFVTEALASRGAGIPSTVRDAVLARAARLSPSARAALEAAAAIGLRIEPWLLMNIVGAESASVEECIAGGMLQFQGDDYSFRHELARQAILETISPERKLALHRMILSVLKESPETRNDLARLANHAEGTKDVSAVLEYAPAAARQASAASSHREAIALYELALRFADTLPPARHAQMLEAYAVELHFPNRLLERMSAHQKAIEIWHSIGDRLREGENLEDLAETLCLLGRKSESEEMSQAAIAVLEGLPPSRELAQAYKSQCLIRMIYRDCAEAVAWGEKAITLAERFKDAETMARAYNYTGCAMMVIDYERGRALMERSLAIGRENNLPYAFAGTLNNLAWMLVEVYQLGDAERYLTEGIAYAAEHVDDYHLLQMLTWQALTRFYQGHWAEAIGIASKVLQSQYLDIETHTCALLALARPNVRRGDPNALAALDKAFDLSTQAEALPRLGPAHAARAERAWLSSNNDRAIEEARAVYQIAVSKEHPWIAGELAFWRWRAGDTFTPPAWIAKSFALQIAGDWRGAADEWKQRSCPYEEALALMDGDEAAQLAALEIFERLGARPATEKLKQRMRSRGVRGIPRGARPATRENPFGLTAREVEVLASLVEGLSNNAIAKKLSLSPRTVEHHIASILQKMQLSSRNEAVVLALKEKLLPFD